MEKSKNGFMKRFDPNLVNDVNRFNKLIVILRYLEQIKNQQLKGH